MLHGDEPFLLDRALALLRQRLAGPDKAGAWRTLWADDDGGRLAGALDDLRSPLLFGGAPVLVVRRAEAFVAAQEEMLLELLPSLAAGRLILVARGLDARRRLLAGFTREGAAYAFPRLADEETARRWVVRLAAERGHEIEPAAVDELVLRTGLELGQLASDVEKASLYAGEGARLAPAHVRATVSATRGHAIEELTDRLARRDLPGATRALRALLGDGEPPIKVVAFLASSLRRALHTAELAEAGLGPDAIAGKLGMPPWLVRKTLGRGSARGLEAALRTLRRLDLELKTSRPPAAVFEAAVLEIVRATAPTR